MNCSLKFSGTVHSITAMHKYICLLRYRFTADQTAAESKKEEERYKRKEEEIFRKALQQRQKEHHLAEPRNTGQGEMQSLSKQQINSQSCIIVVASLGSC